MLAKKRISIVIQGPIISSGNSGSGSINTNFDCSANIQRLIHESEAIVDGYVLATWKDQVFDFQDAKLKVIHLDDPGPQKTFFSTTLNNDFRQMFGCHEGVKFAIEQFSPDYVVKVRTDQYVDIVSLISHMILVDTSTEDYRHASQEGYIYFPNMLSWSPYSVGDFYIGGHTNDLLNFFAAQILYSKHSFSNVRPWVHSDIILKHAYRNLKNTLNLPTFYFFPNITPAFRLDIHPAPGGFKYSSEVLILWAEILTKSISIYPKEIAATMEWRGSTFATEKHSTGEFYNEWLDARTSPQKWIIAKHPKLYTDTKSLNWLDRFINFNTEKRLEIDSNYPVPQRHLYRIARFSICIATGQFPREEFFIEIWSRLKRLYSKRKSVKKQ